MKTPGYVNESPAWREPTRHAAAFEAKLEQRIAELETKLRAEIASVRGEFSDLKAKLSNLKAELIKWMFLFWLGTVATMLGFGRFLLTG